MSFDIADLTDDEFSGLVDRDVRRKTNMTEYNMIREPRNAVRWHRELVFISDDLGAQLFEARQAGKDDLNQERIRRLATVNKHLIQMKRQAKYAMDALGLVDTGDSQIIPRLQAVEQALAQGDLESAKHLIEKALDLLERRNINRKETA